jgi:hypothetical protein
VWVPECESIADNVGQSGPTTVSAAYVLSLDGDDHEQAYFERKRFLARHGIDLQRFRAANGERVIATMHI